MSSALTVSLTLLVLGSTVAALPLQKKKKEPPPKDQQSEAPALQPFAGTLAQARAAAGERNVPILIHVLLDDEVENDKYRDKVLADPDLRRSSLEVLSIVANAGAHTPRAIEREEGGVRVRREVCGAYGFDSCAIHRAAWDELFVQFQQGGVIRCPQTIVVLPDGKVSSRIDTRHVPAVTEVLAALLVARNQIGPGMTEKQLFEVRKLLEQGRALQAAQAWAQAWRVWHSVLAITSHSPAALDARKEQVLAAEGLSLELERIFALLVPGAAAQGYAELAAFVAQAAGTPLEKDAALMLKKAEADKTLRDEIAAYKVAAEADQLLREATELFAREQAKEAEKNLRKLFGKRFRSTPAAAKARERWPELAAQAASKGKSDVPR